MYFFFQSDLKYSSIHLISKFVKNVQFALLDHFSQFHTKTVCFYVKRPLRNGGGRACFPKESPPLLRAFKDNEIKCKSRGN